MCNCSKKRNTLNRSTNNFISQQTQPVSQQQVQSLPPQTKQTVLFQYTGKTALTVTGSITRKNYRFNFPGDIQHIAFSDSAAMAAIAVLKRV